MTLVLYSVQLVGGPYDGAPGLHWAEDDEHAAPDEIMVGWCAGDGACGAPDCGRAPAPTRRHVAYWTMNEDVPTGTIRYRREDVYLVDVERRRGVARYVYGGLDMFGSLEERELVGVAA